MAEGGYDPNEIDTYPDDNDRTPLIPRRGGEEIGMRRRAPFISRPPPPRHITSTSTSLWRIQGGFGGLSRTPLWLTH